MTSLAATVPVEATRELRLPVTAVRYLAPVGRAFLAAIFLASAPGHFSREMIGYAEANGVPFADVLVPIAGIIAFLGGLSVLLGYRARVGAALLALFLVPVTLFMHAFWSIPDPEAAELQQIMFMKNLSMLGGALLVAYFGAGAVSFDARRP